MKKHHNEIVKGIQTLGEEKERLQRVVQEMENIIAVKDRIIANQQALFATKDSIITSQKSIIEGQAKELVSYQTMPALNAASLYRPLSPTLFAAPAPSHIDHQLTDENELSQYFNSTY